MKYDYKGDIKLKLSNIKHNKIYLDKIKDFEFDITDIFHSVILTEIEHQCGVGSLKSFNFSILPVQEKDATGRKITRLRGKDRKAAYSRRALQELDGWLAEFS